MLPEQKTLLDIEQELISIEDAIRVVLEYYNEGFLSYEIFQHALPSLSSLQLTLDKILEQKKQETTKVLKCLNERKKEDEKTKKDTSSRK